MAEPKVPEPEKSGLIEALERGDFPFHLLFADPEESSLVKFVPVINLIFLVIILIMLFTKK